MTIVESCLSHRAFGKRSRCELLARSDGWRCSSSALTAVIRSRTSGAAASSGSPSRRPTSRGSSSPRSLIGVLAPGILLALPKVRKHTTGLFVAALLIVMGVILNRLNVSVTGMERSSGSIYVPALTEVIITLSVVGVGFLIFALAVKFLPVFPEHEMKEARPIVVPEGGNIAGQPLRSLPVPALVVVALAFFGAVALGADGVRRREVDPGPPAPRDEARAGRRARELHAAGRDRLPAGTRQPGAGLLPSRLARRRLRARLPLLPRELVLVPRPQGRRPRRTDARREALRRLPRRDLGVRHRRRLLPCHKAE